MAIHAGSTAFALFCLLLFSALSTKWGLHAAMGSGVTTSGHLIKFGRSFLLFRSDNHYWNQEMDVRAFCQNVDKYARKQNACPSEGHKTLHIGTFSSPKIPTQDLSLSSLSFTSCPKEKTTETYKGHVAWVTPPFHVPFTLPPALHQQPPTSPPKECQTKKKKKRGRSPSDHDGQTFQCLLHLKVQNSKWCWKTQGMLLKLSQAVGLQVVYKLTLSNDLPSPTLAVQCYSPKSNCQYESTRDRSSWLCSIQNS